MLETLLQNLGVTVSGAQERAQGAAFLRVAREAYPLSSVIYVALNIPIKTGGTQRFVHCTYADVWARHAASSERANVEGLGLAALFQDGRDDGECTSPAASRASDQAERRSAIALTSYHGESVALVIEPDGSVSDCLDRGGAMVREFRALGQYFHQHMLRIFGRGDEKAMIVSAREIDCLRWMAAGKTAWEASAILGISERTVRFHLNAAREKLQCATTTQAVAKAISQQLFVL